MTWIIIALVLLAAFGPVLWLMPSRRDKRLAALRQRAMGEGLMLELKRLPKQRPTAEERVSAGGRIKRPMVECMGYMQSLAKRLKRVPGWRIVRGGDGREAHRGWTFDPDTGPVEPAANLSLERLAPVLDALPGDVIGFELEPRRVGAFWLESPGAGPDSVTELAELLRDAEQRLLALDAELQALASDEDS